MTDYRKPSVPEQVFLLIQAAGQQGLTDKEGARLMGGTTRPAFQAYAKRRQDLVLKGRVKQSRQRRPDPITDRLQKVWVAA